MIKLFLISVISLITSVVVISDEPQKKDDDIHRFIFTLSSMYTSSGDDALAITKILVDQIKKKKKRIEKTEVLVYRNTNELLEKATNGFDFMIISTAEYLTLRKSLPLQPSLVASSEGHYGVKYLLLVNKNDNINSITQLKSKDLRILGGENQPTPELVIERLLRLNKLPKKELFFRSISFDHLTNNAVLPVFFKKATAALVSEQAFNFVCDLNPQVRRDLKIIYTSPNYIASIACFNKKDDDTELYELAYDIMINLHTEPFGRQLLDLFRVEKMIPYKEEYLNEYIKLLEK